MKMLSSGMLRHTSETSVSFYQITRRYIPEGSHLHTKD
jgi:hypothetical protein